MARGSVALDQWIVSAEKLGEMAKEVVPIIARVVETELKRSIDAGTDPYGEAWKLTRDGRVPLRNAMKAVKVVAIGRQVFIRVTGPEAKHHLGAVWGKVKRGIIPSKKQLPDRMAAGIKLALDQWFRENVKEAANG